MIRGKNERRNPQNINRDKLGRHKKKRKRKKCHTERREKSRTNMERKLKEHREVNEAGREENKLSLWSPCRRTEIQGLT